MEKNGKLEVVSKYAGIRLSGSTDWINPSDEVKTDFITNIKDLQNKIGKNLNVICNTKGEYESIIVINEVKEEDVKFDGAKVENYSLAKKEHIINLQGKEYITLAGLLDIAHRMGLQRINTDLVSISDDLVIFKAKVTMNDKKEYTGYGDATSNNVNKMILNHRIRMAETRSVARALRWATNIGMTAYEELGGD